MKGFRLLEGLTCNLDTYLYEFMQGASLIIITDMMYFIKVIEYSDNAL